MRFRRALDRQNVTEARASLRAFAGLRDAPAAHDLPLPHPPSRRLTASGTLRSRLPNASAAGAVEVNGSLERLDDALGRSIVVAVTSNLEPFYKSPKVAPREDLSR